MTRGSSTAASTTPSRSVSLASSATASPPPRSGASSAWPPASSAPSTSKRSLGSGCPSWDLAKRSSSIIILDDFTCCQGCSLGTVCLCKYSEIHPVPAYC